MAAFVGLDKSLHDRSSFDCGEQEPNNFIQQKASVHMELGISRTIVFPASTPLSNGKFAICSFFTASISTVSRDDLPQGKKLPLYPIPVYLLAQLAVNNSSKGKGLGGITLIKALKFFWELNKQIRAYAIVVDCLNKAAQSFYKHYGFIDLVIVNGRQRMYIPMGTISQLAAQKGW